MAPKHKSSKRITMMDIVDASAKHHLSPSFVAFLAETSFYFRTRADLMKPLLVTQAKYILESITDGLEYEKWFLKNTKKVRALHKAVYSYLPARERSKKRFAKVMSQLRRRSRKSKSRKKRRSPKRRKSKSPKKRRSPKRRKSKSPRKRRSPKRRKSKSPRKRKSSKRRCPPGKTTHKGPRGGKYYWHVGRKIYCS
jgi:hypothetical protein